MGPSFIKCRAARNANLLHKSVNCTTGPDLGKSTSRRHTRIGSLDNMSREEMSMTFRGSRSSTKEKQVNQSITSSFDPATMTCLACKDKHNILREEGFVVLFTDQNFPAVVKGRTSCLPVVRIEDATLEDVFAIALEMFDRQQLPNGTHFLVGSVSHLSMVGTSIYCSDWIQLCKNFNNRWKHSTVGPLPPVITA